MHESHHEKSSTKPRATRRVPRHIAEDLLYQSDHTCCLCRRKEHDVQIHHIDPAKGNDSDNLIPLCPNCHSEVERKGGFGRRYSPGLLRKARAEWFAIVRNRRRQAEATRFKADLTAMAAFEARRTAYKIEVQRWGTRDWEQIDHCLSGLIPLARDFGCSVRSEAVSAASLVADVTRSGMPVQVARTISALLSEALPIKGGLRHPSRRAISTEEKLLIENIAEVAFSLAYDACRDLRNVGILQAAEGVFYAALRYAHLNKIENVEKEILNYISQCEVACRETRRGGSFREGIQLLVQLRSDALERAGY